jgi:hypothetical protein
MNPELRLRTEQIIRQHPNVMRLLFRNIKQHLLLGIGEEKVKDVLAEKIPDWIFRLSESDPQSLRGSTSAGSRVLPLPSSSGSWR